MRSVRRGAVSWMRATPEIHGCRPNTYGVDLLIFSVRRAHGIPVPRRSPSANRPLKVATRCFALDPEGRPSGPSPPPRAVAGPTRGRKTNGYALPISDVYKEKPIYPSGDHGRGSLLAPGVFTLGTKPDRGPTHTRTRTQGSHLVIFQFIAGTSVSKST